MVVSSIRLPALSATVFFAIWAPCSGATNIGYYGENFDNSVEVEPVRKLIDYSRLTEESVAEYMQSTGKTINELLFVTAEKTSNPESIDLLVSLGADVNLGQKRCRKRNCYVVSPLHRSARYNSNPSVTRALLAHGAQVDAIDEKFGLQPIHEAASYSINPAVIEALLDHGANVNATSKNGETSLHKASDDNDIIIVRFLVERGADMSVRDKEGYLPIHEAAESRYTSNLEFFINAGIDVNSVTGDGYTPLLIAVRRKNYNSVNLLLENGANPAVATSSGYSPLHAAAYRHADINVISQLISNGANINAMTNGGRTPLAFSLYDTPHPEYIEELLKLGADPNMGDSPEAFLYDNAYCLEILDLLREYGSKSYPMQEFYWCSFLPGLNEFQEYISNSLSRLFSKVR